MNSVNQNNKILVVDDNEYNRNLVKAYLTPAGFEVITADNGSAALDAFILESPQLILLDIMMPGMNGYEVCERLRKMPGGDDVGIVFLTALDDLGAHQRAIEAGGDDFLTKPINRDELIMRARSLIWISCLRNEIEEGYDLLRRQRDSLLTSQRQKDDLIGFLVHDLKNLLATQISNADFLTRQLSDHEILRDAAADIHEVGCSMLKMVVEMLNVAQSEDGGLVLRPATVDVSALLENLAPSFQRKIVQSGMNITFTIEAEPDITAIMDEDLFSRVIENLLDNACCFSPDRGEITIHARHAGDGFLLEVVDEGPGIPEEEREAIFQKYYQIEKRKGGSGVGLAFCRIVTLEHGGAIWVEDNEPRGSRFRVQLPRVPPMRKPD